jgi:hypothetical protein
VQFIFKCEVDYIVLCDSSLGTVTRLQAARQRTMGLIPDREGEIFLHTVKTDSASYPTDTLSSFAGDKENGTRS